MLDKEVIGKLILANGFIGKENLKEGKWKFGLELEFKFAFSFKTLSTTWIFRSRRFGSEFSRPSP
jgi:hypothetical protein